MALTQQISGDLKAAMKSGDKTKLETLRMLRAQIIEFEKKGLDREMNADDELSILLSAVKRRKEAIEQYTAAGRMELVAQETQEMEIISAYLPKQMSRDKAEEIVLALIKQTGAAGMKEMSKVMPLAMKELKGKIDSKLISDIVKEKLGA
ncbi:MAG: GatB/YqeY domain-containing protein [Ignavibacteriales bacterium]|nr:GatB/YqeY domain-containing protein [Ignavibacteriales bacterium]